MGKSPRKGRAANPLSGEVVFGCGSRVRIALEVLTCRGQKGIADIAGSYGLSVEEVSEWAAVAMNALYSAFGDAPEKKKRRRRRKSAETNPVTPSSESCSRSVQANSHAEASRSWARSKRRFVEELLQRADHSVGRGAGEPADCDESGLVLRSRSEALAEALRELDRRNRSRSPEP